jgi:hypothetical protein
LFAGDLKKEQALLVGIGPGGTLFIPVLRASRHDSSPLIARPWDQLRVQITPGCTPAAKIISGGERARRIPHSSHAAASAAGIGT